MLLTITTTAMKRERFSISFNTKLQISYFFMAAKMCKMIISCSMHHFNNTIHDQTLLSQKFISIRQEVLFDMNPYLVMLVAIICSR